jgi:hypothetical protein
MRLTSLKYLAIKSLAQAYLKSVYSEDGDCDDAVSPISCENVPSEVFEDAIAVTASFPLRMTFCKMKGLPPTLAYVKLFFSCKDLPNHY